MQDEGGVVCLHLQLCCKRANGLRPIIQKKKKDKNQRIGLLK